MDELLVQLYKTKIVSKLDLWFDYHQTRIKGSGIHKTAFRTGMGHFECTVLPFGLTNTPAIFMHLMHDLFRLLLGKCVTVFLDNILVYSEYEESYEQHLRQKLSLLRDRQLYVKKQM
jgi:hypothetical protein